MFVVMYRWEIVDGREDEFREGWEALTRAYMQLFGSLGSRLHAADDGTWIAYAQWPSRERYFAAVERGMPDEAAAEKMNAAVERRLDPIFMQTDTDLLEQ